MNKSWGYLKQAAYSVLCGFGLMQFVFLMINLISSRREIVWVQTVSSLIVAVIFGLSHFLIVSDWLDGRMTVKRRAVCCAGPCTVAGAVLAKELGLQGLIPYIDNVNAASLLWIISYALSVLVYAGVFFVLEINCRRQSKKYNTALNWYKKKQDQ